MPVLSLPPEILLVIFRSEVLSREDLKNGRLTCTEFEKAAASRLFSALSIDFSPPEGRQSPSLVRRIHDLAYPTPVSPRIPRSISELSITFPDNTDDESVSFLGGCGKCFLGYFDNIRCLKLDVQLNPDDHAVIYSLQTTAFLEALRDITVKIGRFEIRAHHRFIASLTGVSLSSLAPMFYSAEDISSDELSTTTLSASTVIARAIAESQIPLEQLDMSSAWELNLTAFGFWDSIIARKTSPLTSLRSLALSTSQLPTEKHRGFVAGLQCLQKLEIVDKDDPDDLPEGYFRPQETFWRILASVKVKLRSITVPALSVALLDYISTCGGKLVVLEVTSGDVIMDGTSYSFYRQERFWGPEMGSIALRFCKETLPSLSDHLERFSLAVQLLASRDEDWHSSNEYSLGSYLFTGHEYSPLFSPPHERLTGLMEMLVNMKKLEEVDISIEGWTTLADLDEPVIKDGLDMVEKWEYPYEGSEKSWREGMKLFMSWGCQGDLKDDAYKKEHPLYRTDYELLLRDSKFWGFNMLKRYHHNE